MSNFGGKEHATMGICKRCGQWKDVDDYSWFTSELRANGAEGEIYCYDCFPKTEIGIAHQAQLDKEKEERRPAYEAWRKEHGLD